MVAAERWHEQLEDAEARLASAETEARTTLEDYEDAKVALSDATEAYSRAQVILDRARRRVNEVRQALAMESVDYGD